ncbi:MAG: tetratricopeptide repeat protein [bacterium]|nr:tetratricopeptide repeat protein [bacterium]
MTNLLRFFLSFLLITTLVFSLTPKDIYEEGEKLLKEGKRSEAIAKFLLATKQNPYYKEAYCKLGEVYSQKGDYKEAIIAFKEAIKIDEHYLGARNLLGLAYEADNQINLALACYQECLKIDPLNLAVHYNLAKAFSKKGKIQDAISEYEKIIEISPDYILAWIGLGTLRWKEQGLYDEAIDCFKEAERIDPTSPLPAINLGDLYFNQKKLEKAESSYKKALEKERDNLYGLKKLGQIYLDRKEYQKAGNIYKRLSGLLPDDPIIYYALGIIMEAQEAYGTASSFYEKSLSLSMDDETVLFRLDRIILEKEKESVYSERRRNSAAIHFNLGEYYFKERFIPLALYEYKISCLLNPQDANTRYKLSKVYEVEGLLSDACDEMMKARELSPTDQVYTDYLEKIYFKHKRGFIFREGIDISQVPSPIISIFVPKFIQKEGLHAELPEFANNLFLSLLASSYKVKVFSEKEHGEKEEAIRKAISLSATFFLWVEIEEEKDTMKLNSSLIDLFSLSEVFNIVSIGVGKNKIKDAVLHLSEKVIAAVPISGNIFKIEGDRVWINIGTKQGLSDKDSLEIVEKGRKIGELKISQMSALVSKAKVSTSQTEEFLRIGQEVRVIRKKQQ